jgi:hypothetical protein
MSLIITKELVNECRRIGYLKYVACQAVEQLEEKDKEIAKLNGELKDIADDRNEFKQLYSEQTEKLCIEKTNADTLEQAWRQSQRALWMTRATALKRLDVDKYIRKHMNSIFWQDGVRTFNEACYSMKAILLVQIRKCHAKAEEYK